MAQINLRMVRDQPEDTWPFIALPSSTTDDMLNDVQQAALPGYIHRIG